MAQVKIFEVRDRGTCIPVVAVALRENTDQERKLAARAGYGPDQDTQDPYVLLSPLSGGQRLHSDVYAWGGPSRTLHTAHQYIQLNWTILETGAVIDVRYIVGETETPAASDVG